jgi:acyl transferase domain-containing protein
VLSALAHDGMPEDEVEGCGFIPASRKDRSELEALIAALGELYARGHHLDWSAISDAFKDLPTFALSWRS